uniref:Nucleoporin 43 n=1 Tax=Oryzias sinensis TaxID=183150 RepID=A0A8C7Z5P7_9TELE
MENINAKYVSQKISKTRWCPVSYSSLQQPEVFATGSWDNEDNKVSIWSIGNHNNSGLEDGFEGDPQILCEHKHGGDVLDLQFLDQERMVSASSTGAVTIFRYHPNTHTISVLQHWARAHSYPCDNAPCTALVCSSPEIVTVGEDGRIVVFRADQEGAVRVIGEMRTRMLPPHKESSLKLSVVFVRECRQQHNSRGDLPKDHGGFDGDRAPLHCVDRHPNQQHIVATGGQDGMLCVWDVRQGGTPISLMEAHSAEMWEVRFHPTNPDHLFTCSEDGSLLHWETASHSEMPSFLQGGRNSSVISHGALTPAGGNRPLSSAWLCGDSGKGCLETTHMLPSQTMSVNSLDIIGQCLVCGTDGEAIFVNRHVPV